MAHEHEHHFDPVVLDLADHETHRIVIAALRHYANMLDDAVVDPDKRSELIAPTGDSTDPDQYSRAAATVREIISDIEQQLASNQSAREKNFL